MENFCFLFIYRHLYVGHYVCMYTCVCSLRQEEVLEFIEARVTGKYELSSIGARLELRVTGV